MDSGNIKPVVFDPKFIIPSDIVDDVICRFLLNIPKEEKFDPIRVSFQIELAHWFFVDYYCGEGCDSQLTPLRNIPYNQFAYIMFQKTPHLKSRLPEIDKHLAAFREYKMRVPTFGAILLNQNLTKCVLVQGFRNHWGFPKGKVNEVEEPVSCAIREVFEETGYDIGSLVNKEHFIESKVLERTDRLYIVRGVDPKYPFQPQTQFEIKNVRWFNISELPEHKKDTNPAILKSGVPISNFYSVYPYVKRLKMWITDKLEGRNKIQNFKVRLENEMTENQQQQQQQQMLSSSSHHRNSKKVVGGQKSANLNTPQIPPFEFQHQFMPSLSNAPNSGQGWTLFQGENKSYVMNPNAIQELLLNSQKQLQLQQRNTSGNIAAKQSKGAANKNTRRRLFTEDSSSGKQQQHSSSSRSVSTSKPGIQNQGSDLRSTQKTVETRNLLLNSSIWTSFSFDRERVYKAFFSPPSV